MEVQINSWERVDDLQRKGRLLIQNPAMFCFGIDAVFLSWFAKTKKGDRCLDLCTGNGIVPILMEARNETATFTGVEVQKESADLARRSVLLNGKQDRIRILEMDIKEKSEELKNGSFHVVTCNPPYLKSEGGLESPNRAKAIARAEVLCTLDDVIYAASRYLMPGGRFYMVYRAFRLFEAMETMKKYGIEPKRLQQVQAYEDRVPAIILLEGLKGGKSGMQVDPALIIYDENGEYRKAVREIYSDAE